MSPRYFPVPDDWPLLPVRYAVMDRLTGRKVTTEKPPGWMRFLTERAAARLNRDVARAASSGPRPVRKYQRG